MKKNIVKVFVLLLIMISLTSCIVVNKAPTIGDEGMMEEVSEDVLEFRDNFEMLLIGSTKSAIDYLDEKISLLDELEATKAVELLMYYLNQGLNSEDYFLLIERGVEDGIRVDEMDKFYEGINDENINHIYYSLSDNLYRIRVEDEAYLSHYSYVDIDYDAVLEKYKDFIYDDLALLIGFYRDEIVNLYDEEEGVMLLDNLLKNIIEIKKAIKHNEDSAYINEYQSNLDYYYQAYFGAINDGFGIYDNEDKFYDYIIEHYRDVVNREIDEDVKDKVKLFLEELEKEDYKMSDNLKVFLLDFTNMEYESLNY